MTATQQPLRDRLLRIREIGRQIADLSKEYKALRLSLAGDYANLPKCNANPGHGLQPEAVVILGGTVAYIRPVFETSDSKKLHDVTVTFDDAEVLERLP